MIRPFDILGLGCTAVDDLLYVDAYPAADSKAQVRRAERQGGGLTATALVAAARMGARCRYAGGLGTDELSQFVERRFRQEGIELDYADRQAGGRPVHSVIIVDPHRQTRTIFFHTEGAARARVDWPADDLIRAARVLLVDHFGIAGMVRAARIARQANVAVVADLESLPDDPQMAELVGLADHPVTSLDFARRWTGCSDPPRAVEALWSPSRKAVVVTAGAEGCWYLGDGNGGRVRHQPAFPVKALDTTGCGDVFHGAYAAGVAEGLDLPACIRLASAAAGLKAASRDGQMGIPMRTTVDDFLKEHPQ